MIASVLNEETIVGKKGKGSLPRNGKISDDMEIQLVKADTVDEAVDGEVHVLDYFREKDQIIFVLNEILKEYSQVASIKSNFRNDIREVRIDPLMSYLYHI